MNGQVEIGQLEYLTSMKTKGETSLFQRNTVDLNMKMQGDPDK